MYSYLPFYEPIREYINIFSTAKKLVSGVFLFVVFAFAGTPLHAQCFAPAGFQGKVLSTSSVELFWITDNYGISWEIEFIPESQQFIGIPTLSSNSNSIIIGGLPSSAPYKARIRSVCSGGVKSAWSGSILRITTAATNPSQCGLYFRIDDDNCPQFNSFAIQVDQAPGSQLGKDVILERLDLIVRHTFLADLHIYLVSPSGLEIPLFIEHGQSRDHLGNPGDTDCLEVCAFNSMECNALLPIEHANDFIGSFVPDVSLLSMSDGSNPNGIWQIKLCDDAKIDTGSVRYAALHFTPIQCAIIYDDAIITLNDQSVHIGWSLSASPDSILIEYGPLGFIPGAGAFPGSGASLLSFPYEGANNVQLYGLQPGTAYEYYLRTFCLDGGYSDNTCKGTFLTSCSNAVPPVLMDDFDQLQSCGLACFCNTQNPLPGFWQNRLDDDMDWLAKSGPGAVLLQTGPFHDVSIHGNYLFLQTMQTACQNGKHAILESECFIPGSLNGSGCHLSFFYHMWGAGMGTMMLEASKNGGINWQTIWSISGNQGSNWQQANIDLSSFISDTIIIRLTGITGPNRTSQMAIDELALYGVTLLGNGDMFFYPDNDGDGFGDETQPLRTCLSNPPIGYVSNGFDCDDTNALVFPGAPEIPCNQMDENCNGMADDKVLPPPPALHFDVCNSSDITLVIPTQSIGDYYWFTDEIGGIPVFKGNQLALYNVVSDTVFYIMDSLTSGDCFSVRRPIYVQVRDNPLLHVELPDGFCMGNTVDLISLGVLDVYQTGAVISFHDTFPASSQNLLFPPIVPITGQTTVWAYGVTSFGCEHIIPLSLQAFPDLTVQIQSQDTLSICGGTSMLIHSNVTGGTPPYQFNWSTGFHQSWTPLSGATSPGTTLLILEVLDKNQCNASDTVIVKHLETVGSATVQTLDVTSCLGEDGAIWIQPASNAVFHYSWKGAAEGQKYNISGPCFISDLPQGNYKVTITNAETGCAFISPPIVINGPGPKVDGIQVNHESCTDANDGYLHLFLSGPPGQVVWSNGELGPSASMLSPGQYSATITGDQCSIILNDFLIEEATPILIGIQSQTPSCFGSTNGRINLTTSGGTPPYLWQWSTGDQSEDIDELGAGMYAVTITDFRHCIHILDSIMLAEPLPLTSIFVTENSSCFDKYDGQIILSSGGGTPPYQYLWSDNAVIKDRIGLAQGVYQYTLTDHQQCKWVSPEIELTSPEILTTISINIIDETCQGAKNGQIAIVPMGGTAPYKVLWSDGVFGINRTGLSAGIYYFTITDNSDCMFESGPVPLGISHPLTSSGIVITPATCHSLADGQIGLFLSGGSGNFHFEWSPPDADPNHLSGGVYHVTVTDDLGCRFIASNLIVQEKHPLNIHLNSVYFPNCAASAVGNIEITVSGSPPFQYQWSHGYTDEDPHGLTNGFYSVSVTDALGCFSSLEGIPVWNTSDLFQVADWGVSGSRCFGDNNGELWVTTIGGEPPYQYNWSIGIEKDVDAPYHTVDGLSPGAYFVTITDVRGCVVVHGPMLVTEPGPLTYQIPIESIKNETCKGAGDGQITVLINGGTAPYYIDWFVNGNYIASGQVITQLHPGLYSANVIDDQGCKLSLAQPIQILGAPSILAWQEINVDPDDCEGLSTGSIAVKMQGGVPDYNYQWSDGGSGRQRTALKAGVWCVTATDTYGCARDTCLTVGGGSGIDHMLVVFNECNGYSSAYIDLAGGTPPYNVLWSNGDTTLYIQNLATGMYTVTISDASGCGEILEAISIGFEDVVIEHAGVINASPGQKDGAAFINITGGTPPYEVRWDVNTASQMTDTAWQLWPGKYCVLVTDVNLCFDTICVVVGVQTSVHLEESIPSVIIFPNPASDQFNIRFDALPSSKVHWETLFIRDAMGRLAGIIPLDQASHALSIDTRSFHNGMYTLHFFGNQKTELVRRIVIQR